MISELDRRPMIGNNNEGSYGDELENELGLLLGEQRREVFNDRQEELNIYRSGSAPPTVEGSLSAVGGLFGHGISGGSGFPSNGFKSEEEVRSDPTYLSYYYSNVNLNPRLPPPLSSNKEDWRFAKRLQGGGGSSAVGDRRMVNRNENSGSRSLLSMPPGFSSKKQEIDSGGSENVGSVEWGGDGLIGLPGLGLGSKQKSLAEIFQDDLGHVTPVSRALSRPVSRNALDQGTDNSGSAEADLANLRSGSYSYVVALGGGSLSRSSTPDPQAIARAPSPGLAPIGGGRGSRNITSPNSSNDFPLISNESTELAAALSGINLGNSIGQEIDENYLFNLPGNQQHSYLKSDSGASGSSNNSGFRSNSYKKAPSQYHHMVDNSPNSLIPGYNLSGYPANQLNLPPLFENAAAASAIGMDPRMLGLPGMNSPITEQNLRMAAASGLQSPYMDPAYLQYLRSADYLGGQVGAFNDPDRVYMSNLYADFLQKAAYFEKGNFGGIKHTAFYGNPGFGLSYPQSPLVLNSPVGPGSPMRYPSGMRNAGGGVLGPWQFENIDKNFASSLLEEFKSTKTKCFELSEIAGHVVEFSGDQYGSRFIQQKLETATIEEKNMVYNEISPHALTLMTDVFGNYVIQKFFEHGMASQRRELARKLIGNVLSMSLQMYGCRVIQKAIEVVDEDQKIQMVKELDGQVMNCVHDQNGNHVIQKCIECIPEEYIHFIVSTFFGQVVNLSSHSYGCRVIQRVLEHCNNPDTQSKVMEEILSSISKLTLDQYGNYVMQHVLEHGKPIERSTIIKELAPKIVEMSQQKFASNVVEKCLTFGDPNEFQLLVNEMLGTTDENEPLQAMMKDQYANYVVQKVLETCSDQQRELIMSRIKVHLNGLQRYTYGKHIVTRIEKLLAAGERRIAASHGESSLLNHK